MATKRSITVEIKRWKRLLALFAKDEKKLGDLEWLLLLRLDECVRLQPAETRLIKRAWYDLIAVVREVLQGAVEEEKR